jgi:hypothetical protein
LREEGGRLCIPAINEGRTLEWQALSTTIAEQYRAQGLIVVQDDEDQYLCGFRGVSLRPNEHYHLLGGFQRNQSLLLLASGVALEHGFIVSMGCCTGRNFRQCLLSTERFAEFFYPLTRSLRLL